MFYVYLLRSIPHPDETYVGFTNDLRSRFKAHNAGQSKHTARCKPWQLVTYLAFDSESKARDFEKYLKSHSGMAFARKRLWCQEYLSPALPTARLPPSTPAPDPPSRETW